MKNEKKITRRRFIKDSAMAAAGVSALAVGTSSGLSLLTREAWAQSNLRSEILKIPGVGKGSPTDSDWQKVGAMCLGSTKSNVSEDEFKGVKRSYIPMHSVVRIDEVEKQGAGKISESPNSGGKVSSLPFPGTSPGVRGRDD